MTVTDMSRVLMHTIRLILALLFLIELALAGGNDVSTNPMPATQRDAARLANSTVGQGADLVENAPQAVASLAALRGLAMPGKASGWTYRVDTAGYYAPGDAGAGAWTWSGLSMATDDGGTVVNPTGNAGPGRWLRMSASGECARPSWWGAKADDSNDDTAAIQAAMNHALSASGGCVYLTRGTYKITAALSIPLWTNWRLIGESRGNTSIKQYSANTPIFLFNKEDAHSWLISDLTLTWAVAQPATNTAANGLYFQFDTHTGGGAFNWQLERVRFDNGYYLVSVDSSAQNQIWGFKLRNITGQPTTSGGLLYAVPTPTAGQPNIGIDSVYWRADNVSTGKYIIRCAGCDTFSADNIEVNNSLLGAGLLSLVSGGNARIGVIKSEVGSYGIPNFPIITISDVHATIAEAEFASFKVAKPITLISVSGGGSASAKTEHIYTGNHTIIGSGKIYVLGSGVFPNFTNTAQRVTGVVHTGNTWMSNVQSSSAAGGIAVLDWLIPRLSADNGDASVSVSAGVNPPVQQFNTTLTAARTITLADIANGGDSNLFEGFKWTIVRNAATPGAFALNIVSSTGMNVGSIPPGSNGSITFEWQRFAWRVISYSTWTSAAP